VDIPKQQSKQEFWVDTIITEVEILGLNDANYIAMHL
jgi:hypothetical protein